MIDATKAYRIKKRVQQNAQGCWLWGKRPDHVQTTYGGRLVGVHRLAWEAFMGDIPDGLWVLHKCDTPNCCNPAHLYLGTLADNTKDAIDRNRMATGGRNGARLHPESVCRGDNSPHSKLTEEQVMKIKTDCRSSYLIAEEHGVNPSTIQRIRRGESWKHAATIAEASHD